MTPRPIVLAAATLLHAGCVSPDSSSLTIVRDSARVVIAESGLEVSGDEWRLQLPPVLLIGRSEGTGDGPDLFGRINQVIRLSSGDIAVAEGLAAEVRVFDDGGGYLRTFGRRGEGPGEFANLWTISELPGDTIVAVDPFGGRITLFTSSGTFARSFPMPWLPGASAPNPVGWFEDGTLLVDALAQSPSGDARDQSTHFLYSVDRDGEVLEPLGEFAGEQLGRNGLGLAFGARAHFAAGGNLAWYGHSSRYELVGRDRSGSVRRIVRADRIPRAVTQAEIDESRAAAGERLRGMSGPAIDRIRATEFASTHPLHGRFLFDEAGNLWVERSWSDLIADSGAREWDIFDAEGKLTGFLATPGGFRITYIGTQSVLGVHADSLGIETVRMYRLDK
ncbi:MAG: 6-bladed beta-propeller [Gammaproteobacteria bacterium]|nr:6-bladed beta-propeller [Gammaproteobacteria bacterium]MDE0257212.1 6-bladed beta-propeller [Gammaproteobacteria bacterium]